MRKVLILFSLFFACITFAECRFIEDPDQTLRKYMDVVKKSKLTNKLYCDNNGMLMLYWRSDDAASIDIGFMLNDEHAKSLNLMDITNAFVKFADRLTVFDKVKLNSRKGDLIPEKLNIRLYMYDPDVKNTYMIYKIENNFKNAMSSLYYNQKYFSNFIGFIEKANETNDFYPTDDIIN